MKIKFKITFSCVLFIHKIRIANIQYITAFCTIHFSLIDKTETEKKGKKNRYNRAYPMNILCSIIQIYMCIAHVLRLFYAKYTSRERNFDKIEFLSILVAEVIFTACNYLQLKHFIYS